MLCFSHGEKLGSESWEVEPRNEAITMYLAALIYLRVAIPKIFRIILCAEYNFVTILYINSSATLSLQHRYENETYSSSV